MATWITAPEVLDLDVWQDAATLTDDALDLYLEVAQEACEAYAPALAADATVPQRYRLAVVFHARDLSKVTTVSGDQSEVGPDPYTLRVRPLSDAVKALLRPNPGRPRFGRRSTS